MMHILDATDRIRVGSGGVMAMHYGSLQMAERFATPATLHPGRVDMGLGRAPGGDMRAAAALNRGRVIDPDAINALIEDAVRPHRGLEMPGYSALGRGLRPGPPHRRREASGHSILVEARSQHTCEPHGRTRVLPCGGAPDMSGAPRYGRPHEPRERPVRL